MGKLVVLKPKQKFGRLTVLRRNGSGGKVGKRHAIWECLCDCGSVVNVSGSRLAQGEMESCGCLRLEAITKHGKTNTTPYFMWGSAKRRAKEKGLPFDITVDDIVIPVNCPLLGIFLSSNVGCSSFASPTLDRIIPPLGYVKGNIRVISNRANLIKQDASIEELERLVTALRRLAV